VKKLYVRITENLNRAGALESGLIAVGIGVAITTIVGQVGGDLKLLLASAAGF
jgi:Flp pilus assembly pilin Flp